MGDMIASCGCKVKRVMWEITIPEDDGTSYLSVCATCFHKRYKRIAASAKRVYLKYMGVEKTGEDWMLHFTDIIMDPDGWRRGDGCDFFKTKLTYDEYLDRLSECTIKILEPTRKRLVDRKQTVKVGKLGDIIVYRDTHKTNKTELVGYKGRII